MYGELYQYLILHKQLNMPGIGTFQLERKPAQIDFVNKIAEPPSYTLSLHHGNVSATKNVFTWLSDRMNISELDAVRRFNDFALDLKNRILSGDPFQWDGVGTFSKGMAGEIRFESSVKEMKTGVAIPAVKVIRDDAEHTVRVGEDERTSTEMIELLAPAEQRRFQWWGIALIVGMLAFIFIGLYFSSKGFNTASTGNQQKAQPTQSGATYRTLP